MGWRRRDGGLQLAVDAAAVHAAAGQALALHAGLAVQPQVAGQAVAAAQRVLLVKRRPVVEQAVARLGARGTGFLEA